MSLRLSGDSFVNDVFPQNQAIPTKTEGVHCPPCRRWAIALLTGTAILPGVYFAFPPVFPGHDGMRSSFSSLLDHSSLALAVENKSQPVANTAMDANTHCINLLKEGIARLKTHATYTADFSKTERVNGAMTEQQSMRLKLRHAPFSVYLHWTEGKPGQELLYVEGQNDGKMIVRASGFRGILGAIKIDVDGPMAMRESRHPITEMGLLHLAETVLAYRDREAAWKDGFHCTETRVELDGRPCYHFVYEYDNPKQSPTYRKSELWIDEELQLVTKIRNYGWPNEQLAASEVDRNTLLEAYSYKNINFDLQLAAADFSAANDNYRLKRR